MFLKAVRLDGEIEYWLKKMENYLAIMEATWYIYKKKPP